jgi:hypothetical protein
LQKNSEISNSDTFCFFLIGCLSPWVLTKFFTISSSFFSKQTMFYIHMFFQSWCPISLLIWN